MDNVIIRSLVLILKNDKTIAVYRCYIFLSILFFFQTSTNQTDHNPYWTSGGGTQELR